MTQEEKAKRYDEALERAMNVSNSEWSSPQALSEYIFPELAESEDERIRKAISQCVEDMRGLFEKLYSVHHKDAIAWLEKKRYSEFELENEYWRGYKEGKQAILDKYAELEKQGEKPNTVYDKELSEILGRVIRRYINDPNIPYTEREKVSMEIIPYVERLEKQGEQKSDTDFSDLRTWKYIVDAVLTEKEGIGQYLDSPFTEEVAKKLQKRFGKIEQKPDEEYNITGIDSKNAQGKLGEMIKKKLEMEKQGEQKPAELPKGEDYGIDGLYAAIDILQKTLGKVDGYQSDDGILEHKSAIEAVNRLYKQKHEWSEEDETIIYRILAICSDFVKLYEESPASTKVVQKDVDEIEDWLKSLKDRIQPQSQWKPSDAQMASITCSVRKMKESACYDSELVSLLNDLKKLREE